MSLGLAGEHSCTSNSQQLASPETIGFGGSDTHVEVSLANSINRLPLVSDWRQGVITTGFPQKRAMILRRTRPPLLETPFEAFDNSVFTPNDVFYMRRHPATVGTSGLISTFQPSRISGRVEPHAVVHVEGNRRSEDTRVKSPAVNQCSGNSRNYFEPRVAGGQWSNGAMGNARWTGVQPESFWTN